VGVIGFVQIYLDTYLDRDLKRHDSDVGADADNAELTELDAKLSDIKELAEEVDGRKQDLLELKKRVRCVQLVFQG
jgi:hypothetical protein